jgi:predicted membrane metal-binding protein
MAGRPCELLPRHQGNFPFAGSRCRAPSGGQGAGDTRSLLRSPSGLRGQGRDHREAWYGASVTIFFALAPSLATRAS